MFLKLVSFAQQQRKLPGVTVNLKLLVRNWFLPNNSIPVFSAYVKSMNNGHYTAPRTQRIFGKPPHNNKNIDKEINEPSHDKQTK